MNVPDWRLGAPSKEWLLENILHHLGRQEQVEVSALLIVVRMALNGADFKWMAERFPKEFIKVLEVA